MSRRMNLVISGHLTCPNQARHVVATIYEQDAGTPMAGEWWLRGSNAAFVYDGPPLYERPGTAPGYYGVRVAHPDDLALRKVSGSCPKCRQGGSDIQWSVARIREAFVAAAADGQHAVDIPALG